MKRMMWIRCGAGALYALISYVGGVTLGVRLFHIDSSPGTTVYFVIISLLIGAAAAALADLPTPPAPKNEALPTKDDA